MTTFFTHNFWHKLAAYLQQAQLQAELGVWYQTADKTSSQGQ